MRRKLILAALLVTCALPARAESLDTATLQCLDVADGTRPKPEAVALFSWMHGYVGGMRNDTAFDDARYNADLDKMAEICRGGSTKPVLEIFQELPPTPPRPESIDISKMTCGDFASMAEEGTGIILPWIDGYMGHLASDTVYDKAVTDEYMVTVQKECASDTTQNFMAVVRAAAIEE